MNFSSGTDDEVECQIKGCNYGSHDLTDHLADEHRLSPEQYVTVCTGAAVWSEVGRADIAKKAEEELTHRRVPTGPAHRPKKEFSICSTFNIDLGFKLDANGQKVLDAAGQPVRKDPKVDGFADRTEWVPAIDPNYVFPVEETKVFLLGLQLKDNMLLIGHTGTGKTTLVEQIAARLNYQVVKINFDGHITRADLIGEHIVVSRETKFQFGILVHAFQMPGTIIILDEWDAISGECAFVLQRPLQKDDRKILIMELGGVLIPMHPDNCIVATANTNGQGDDTGLYSQGTRVQNYAQLNRFSLTIKLKYLEEAKEIEMLRKRFPQLKPVEAQALVRTVNTVRESFEKGALSAPLSPRDLINWAEKYLKLGDPERAAKYCFMNRMPPEDAAVAEGLIKRIFDHDA